MLLGLDIYSKIELYIKLENKSYGFFILMLFFKQNNRGEDLDKKSAK